MQKRVKNEHAVVEFCHNPDCLSVFSDLSGEDLKAVEGVTQAFEPFEITMVGWRLIEIDPRHARHQVAERILEAAAKFGEKTAWLKEALAD